MPLKRITLTACVCFWSPVSIVRERITYVPVNQCFRVHLSMSDGVYLFIIEWESVFGYVKSFIFRSLDVVHKSNVYFLFNSFTWKKINYLSFFVFLALYFLCYCDKLMPFLCFASIGGLNLFYMCQKQRGCTPLVRAIACGRTDCLRLLLSCRADKNAQDDVRVLINWL